MSVTTPTARIGLLDSLATLAASLLAVAHTRLALLATDLEEGREHLLSLLLLAVIALLALGIGATLLSLTVILAFWDSYRLQALAGVSIVYLLTGIVLWVWVSRRARIIPKLFTGSLSELEKDRQALGSRA